MWSISPKIAIFYQRMAATRRTIRLLCCIQHITVYGKPRTHGASTWLPSTSNEHSTLRPDVNSLTLMIMSLVGDAFNAHIHSIQCLSNLLLNIVTDVELTTSCGKLFQILTTRRLKKFFRRSSRERWTEFGRKLSPKVCSRSFSKFVVKN